jgi:hypothetical protein
VLFLVSVMLLVVSYTHPFTVETRTLSVECDRGLLLMPRPFIMVCSLSRGVWAQGWLMIASACWWWMGRVRSPETGPTPKSRLLKVIAVLALTVYLLIATGIYGAAKSYLVVRSNQQRNERKIRQIRENLEKIRDANPPPVERTSPTTIPAR